MARVVQIARYQADGTQVTREFDKMGQAGEKMGERVKRGAQSMSPALRGVDAAAGAARDKVEGLATSTGSLGRVLTAMGPAGLAAAAAIGGIALAFTALQRAALDAMRTVATVDGLSQQIGVSTDFIQEFRYAVTATGGDISIADNALTSFTRNIGQLNTELGQRAKGALEELGFSDAEIRNMGTAEDALPRIIARIGELDNAAAQMAVAQKLGLESVLETLQAGEIAFDRLRQRAHEVGVVLDREMIERAAEMEDAWKLARLEIDTNFNAALVKLAPLFVRLTESIADAARGLSSMVEQIDRLRGITPTTFESLGENWRRQGELIDRFGENVTMFGDASGRRDFNNPLIISDRQRLILARNEYAYLQQESQRISSELLRRTATPPAGNSPTSPAGAVDAQIAQLRQFVEQLEAEAAARGRLSALMGENVKLSREEAQAAVALEADLTRLRDARAAGVIASDEELERLAGLRRARDEESQALRRQEESRRRLAAVEAANAQLRSQVETPQERLAREMRALDKNADLDPELVARRMRQLQREYRDLAAAQYEASLAGQVLSGVMQGQIRDFESIGMMLLDLATNSLIQELLSGGGGGGVGGFFGRVGDRIASGVTGRDDARWGEMFGQALAPLSEAAKSTATVLADQFAGSAAESAVKMALATTEKVRETTTTAGLNATMGLATKSAQILAAAMQRAAAAASGKEASALVKFGASALTGGDFTPKGGKRDLGGPLIPGRRHSFAEQRPELSIVGGWGQVAPPAAVDGLAVLARLSKQAQSQAQTAPRVAAQPRVTVNVNNNSGVAVDAEVNQSVGEDGALMLELVLTRQQEGALRSGRLDGAMRDRYGARPPMTHRG